MSLLLKSRHHVQELRRGELAVPVHVEHEKHDVDHRLAQPRAALLGELQKHVARQATAFSHALLDFILEPRVAVFQELAKRHVLRLRDPSSGSTHLAARELRGAVDEVLQLPDARARHDAVPEILRADRALPFEVVVLELERVDLRPELRQERLERLQAQLVFAAAVPEEVVHQPAGQVVHVCHRLQTGSVPRRASLRRGQPHVLHHLQELLAAQRPPFVHVELAERRFTLLVREREQRDEEEVLGERDQPVAVGVEHLEEVGAHAGGVFVFVVLLLACQRAASDVLRVRRLEHRHSRAHEIQRGHERPIRALDG
mmetsp:Transcript_15900/g.67029  ORF Transcript_15900/g.67029 Transcript_15900/m.67029 type:complete len:315 (-) Transcript_15900:395-1339(-)